MPATSLEGARHEPRRDRLIHEPVHDPYALRRKPAEPTRCSECGALYLEGRWRWGLLYIDAVQGVCPACHRAADHAPAGVLILTGRFVADHRDDVLFLLRHHEGVERQEHPMHRILDIEEHDGGLVVTTTDIHTPARLGKALERSHHGDLDIRYVEGQYFVRVHWRCDA